MCGFKLAIGIKELEIDSGVLNLIIVHVRVLILSNIIIYKHCIGIWPTGLPPSPTYGVGAHVFIYNPKSVFDPKAQL